MLQRSHRKLTESVLKPLTTKQFWLSRNCTCARHQFYSTKIPSTSKTQDGPKSIFSSQQSVWDHVFSDIGDKPPLLPPHSRSALKIQTPGQPGSGRPRRQTMTAREINAFDEMFNMIFNAVSEQKRSAEDPNAEGSMTSELGIGKGPDSVGDLFGKLRKRSKKLKWTTESDELLDRKKEEMELCDTDQQLLEWAEREVFAESQRYEAEWRKSPTRPMQPATYPHLVGLLMRTFRDKYQDPHLALSIFHHARHLSIASYVFGCSTQAYNELIETRWFCFRDLTGVHDTLEEMTVNGVDFDSRTRKLIEIMRRQLGEQKLWNGANNLESGEMWNLLTKIENLVNSGSGLGSSGRWDTWKQTADSNSEDWAFGLWDKPRNNRKTGSSTKR